MLIVTIITAVISSLALLFSIFTYCKHDRKLKEQEHMLNEYQIHFMEVTDEENKRAIVRAEIIKTGNGKRTLRIHNIGKAKATNLIIEMPNPNELNYSNSLPQLYKELLPNAYRDVILFLCEGEDELTLRYTWTDEYDEINTETQVIDL